MKTNNNGRQANSFFRKGSDILRRILKNTNDSFVQLCTEYIKIMMRWIDIQMAYSQTITRNLRP